MRVVIDTNVWVSALLRTASVPGQAVQLARSRDTVVLTQDTLQELDSVLRRPKFLRYLDPGDRDAVLAALAGNGKLALVAIELRNGPLTAVMSQALAAEYVTVLARPKFRLGARRG